VERADGNREAADKKAAAERYQKLHAQGKWTSLDLQSSTSLRPPLTSQARHLRQRAILHDFKKFDDDEKLPPSSEKPRLRVSCSFRRGSMLTRSEAAREAAEKKEKAAARKI
jgi:hypothetical protein